MNRLLRIAIVLGTLALIGLIATGCSSSAPSGGGGVNGTTITEQNISFNPSTLNVKVGDTVTFQNADSVAHHVVVNNSVDLGIQQPGATVTWKATTPGAIPIKCIIHPTMTGTINVQ